MRHSGRVCRLFRFPTGYIMTHHGLGFWMDGYPVAPVGTEVRPRCFPLRSPELFHTCPPGVGWVRSSVSAGTLAGKRNECIWKRDRLRHHTHLPTIRSASGTRSSPEISFGSRASRSAASVRFSADPL